MSLLIFLIVLSILIIVHEFGHFAMAKRLGVKVERFAVGFGPTLFAKVVDGTEFALCAIPLGGYVKMAGDERGAAKGKSDEFYAKSPGHRALIVLWGPLVNFILAYLCFWFVFVAGYPVLSAKVGELLKDYPAQKAGLQSGDKILNVNGENIESWEQMQRVISTSKSPSLDIVALRNAKKIHTIITPKIENLANVFGQKENIRIIGIKPAEDISVLHYDVLTAAGKAAERLWEITSTTLKALYRIATGAMSAKDSMTGPIGIFYIVQKAAALGLCYLIYILGTISASLAIFNLLPFPVLDGGHLFFTAIEKVRGRPLPPKAEDIINRVGVTLIVCFALFVFYNDFIRFGFIDKIVKLFHKLFKG